MCVCVFESLLLKMASKLVMKCCLVFLKCKKAVRYLMEKIHVLNKTNSSMCDSTVGMNLVLMNRQYTVNELYLKRNTCKTRYILISS